MTGDEFYEMAKGKEQEKGEVARQKEVRKDGRAANKVVIKRWNVAEQKWKDTKVLVNMAFQKVLAA